MLVGTCESRRERGYHNCGEQRMDDFFTLASFATLTGSVFSVVVIVNAIRHALGWGPRWFALVLSVAVAFLALHLTAEAGDQAKTASLGLLKYAVAFINGCLIYTSAFGIQNAVIAPTTEMSRNIKLGITSGGAPKTASRDSVSVSNDEKAAAVGRVHQLRATSPW
jgi:hypothetical protein